LLEGRRATINTGRKVSLVIVLHVFLITFRRHERYLTHQYDAKKKGFVRF